MRIWFTQSSLKKDFGIATISRLYALEMKIAAVAILAITSPCLAMSVQNSSEDVSCPVQVIQAYFLGGRGIEHTFYLSYVNQSTKVVIGAKFGFDLLDGVGDLHPMKDLVTSRKTKVGKRDLNTTFPVYEQPMRGLRVYVKKIAFEDGSTWEDDGTLRCARVEDRLR